MKPWTTEIKSDPVPLKKEPEQAVKESQPEPSAAAGAKGKKKAKKPEEAPATKVEEAKTVV